MKAVRCVRRTALLHPFQLPVVVSLLTVAIVFTVSPRLLEHSPVSFETRGVIHHAWHYGLLFGALLALIGLFMTRPVRHIGRGRFKVKLPFGVRLEPLGVEFAGLVLLALAVALNLVALTANEFGNVESVGRGDAMSGLGAALRFGVLAGLCIRIWINRAQPTVDLPVRPDA